MFKYDMIMMHNFCQGEWTNDFEILAVWSLMKENANFVCLEPWNGIQKEFVADHEKMGVLSLKAYQSKQYIYTIEVIN